MSSLESTATPASSPKTAGAAVSGRLDRVVSWFKWPAAIGGLILAPVTLWALIRVLGQAITAPTFSLIPFALGASAFYLLWRRWLRTSRWGSFMITLEHESTHALFALMTGHAIVGFRASLGKGGEVRFAGPGNWLVTSAPYFFPTAAIILFLLAYFLPFSALPWQSFLLGVALAYHIISTIRETHRDQSDLILLGRTFCWMFLPAANLAVVGILLAFAHSGSDGLHYWLNQLYLPITYIQAFLLPS